jgi:chloramphenicol 3-O phosphotransferase
MGTPEVIFLDGPTSAGKTSLARALQARLPGLFMHLGIDHFIQMAPLKLHGVVEGFRLVPQPDGTLPIVVGETAERVLDAYRASVRAIAAQGTGVVVDEVLLEKAWLERWVQELAGVDVFFIGVHCALTELERRELARGDRGRGQARSQHERVHRHAEYDFTVDTTETDAERCAAAIHEAFDLRTSPSAFERLRSGRQGSGLRIP